MIKLFKAPKSSYTTTYDLDRFELSWYTNLLLAPLFGLLLCIHFLSEDPDIATSSSVFLGTLLNLFILKKKRSFLIPSYLFVGIGTAALQWSLFAVNDSKLITALMYILLLSLIGYYLLGKLRGSLILLMNMLSIIIYISLAKEGLERTEISADDNHAIIIYNISIASIAISLIVYKIIHSIEKHNRELSRANKKLIAQNNEKTVLLKEVHHRVKNNLQLISSLLRLQSNQLNKPEISAPFKDAVNRIKSMALIHEKIYEKEDLSKLDLSLYLNSLINEIIDSYSSKQKVKHSVQTQIKSIDTENIVPLAILFNELLTNSIKHGFENEKGKIEIELVQNQNSLEIRYWDSGFWKLGNKPKNNFGSQLIESICEQMDGKYSLDTSNGTEYQFQLTLSQKSNPKKHLALEN